MDRSASPRRDSAAANRGGSEYTYLHSKGELEEREILREIKRVRYPDHHRNESFAEPSERRYFSHERLPRRHKTDSRRGGKHEHSRSSRASPKGIYQGGTAIKSAIHVPEDESRESIYQRRDSDASFGQRQPHRDTNVSFRILGKSHHQQAEGYSSFPQGMRHNQADRQCDYKDGYIVKHDSGLSRSGLKPRDEITANDAHRSLKWRSHDDKTSSPRKHCKSLSRNEPKWDEETTDKGAPHSTKMSNKVSWGNNIESDNRLSWNGPKWGEETTSKDSPTCSKWGEETTSKDNRVCDKEADNSSPCNGPNWGEETNSKNAPNSSQWKSVANDRDPNVETDNNSSCTGSKWGGKANVKDVPSSWGSPTMKCYPKEPHNTSSSWNDQTLDHRENTKEASCSSKWISDDKWGYNVKTDNSSSWSKWGDETTTKDAPNSWRSSSTKRDSKKTNSSSSYDPKWDDRARKNAAGSSQRKSDYDNLGSNVKTANSSSWPKWPDKATTRDGSNSWRSSPAKRYPKETNNHSSWNAPKCDDRATTKNVPSSSQWRSEVDKWGSNVKTDNSSWPNWGDETTTKDEPNSWRSSTAQWDSKETSISSSCKVPKGDDRVTTDDAPDSSQWRSEVDKWDSNVKTGNSSSWTKWGDGTTAKDEPNSWRSSTAKRDSKETSNDSSWNAPKWDDRETTKEAPGSSRSNVDKWRSNAKSHNSLSWPKWGDEATTNDRHNSSKSGTNADDRQGSLWPKRGADTTNNDTQNSSQWRRNADRQGSDVKTDNISSWPKWGDDTANNGRQGSNVKIDDSSSWPKWGADSTNKDVHNSSQWRANRQDSNVKTYYSSSGNGQKRDDKTTAEDAPNSSSMRANSHRQCSTVETDNSLTMKGTMLGDDDKRAADNMENQKPSWNDRKRDGYKTTKDSPRSSRWRSDGVKQDYSLKISNSFSFDRPKCDGQTFTENFPHSSQYRSYSERKQYDVKANSRLSQTDSKSGDQNMLHEACQMSLPAHEQNITQETSQKVQHILKTSQSPSSNHNLTEQNGKDKQNLSTGHCYSHQVIFQNSN